MLLIRNAAIHTMTEAGTLRGDLLISDGKIQRMEKEIATKDLNTERTIDAAGLHVYPGFIDAHMHLVRASEDEEKNVRDICSDALASGVTTQALWPDQSGLCRIFHGREQAETDRRIRSVHMEALSDSQLAALMQEAAEDGVQLACEIYGERQLRRALKYGRENGCRLILAHLSGCEDCIREIAEFGCGVILGASVMRCGSSYAMAAALAELGVRVALSADYPATRLHHLPLCAGLCVRAGMDRDAAIGAITCHAAELLSLDHLCGSIRKGMRADLTLFDGDPLLLATAHVMTISGGVIEKES